MKRLVIAALAIGAMATCTKSNVQYEQPGEISLQPVAQKATKAAVDGTYYPTETAYNFNVWAWWADETAGTALAEFTSTTDYIAEGTFTARNNVSWGGVTPYYWPTKGSLVFAGYSPASAKVEGTEFKYYLTAQGTAGEGGYIAPNTLRITNFTQPIELEQTHDLMWFDVTDNSHNNNGTAGVPVTFKHALSWLTFKFVLADNITTHQWEITDVKLQNVNTKGDFIATKSEGVINAGTWTLSTNDADKKVMTVYDTNTHIVSTTPTKLEKAENGVVVIPQECVKLYIIYNLTASTGEKISQDVTLDLATGIAEGKWLPGKHYIYTITFGANEILIAPQVADWEDVEVENIPVQ